MQSGPLRHPEEMRMEEEKKIKNLFGVINQVKENNLLKVMNGNQVILDTTAGHTYIDPLKHLLD